MKKLISVLLIVILLLSAVGCGKDEEQGININADGEAVEAASDNGASANSDKSGERSFTVSTRLSGNKKDDYENAQNAMKNGDYETAYAMFCELGKYKDSGELAMECYYLIAQELYKKGDYKSAKTYFDVLDDYKDSASQAALCGEKLYSERFIGTWVCENLDITEKYQTVLTEKMDEELRNCLTVSNLTLNLVMKLNTDGSFVISLDEDALSESMDGLIADLTEGVVRYAEGVYKELADGYGLTLEELFAAMEVEDTDGLFAMDIGCSVEEYVAETVTKESLMEEFQDYSESGTYVLTDGKLTLNTSEGSLEAEYDPDADTLTILESAMGDRLTFKKQG